MSDSSPALERVEPRPDSGSGRCACGQTRAQHQQLCKDCWTRREMGAISAALGAMGSSHRRARGPFARAPKPSIGRL